MTWPMRSRSSEMSTDTTLFVPPRTPTCRRSPRSTSLLARGAAMPPGIHPPDDVRAWVGTWDLTERDVWVAESDGATRRLRQPDPDLARWPVRRPRRPARRASARPCSTSPSRCAPTGSACGSSRSTNPRARSTLRHGLVALERTDGSANEEHAPDVKMVWPGADPLAYFRSLIDDADLVLGDVLARRAALTRVVRDHKRATSASPIRPGTPRVSRRSSTGWPRSPPSWAGADRADHARRSSPSRSTPPR